jgi:hypothetical protein
LRLFNKTYRKQKSKIIFGEVFEVSEYGKQLTPEIKKTLFPF